MMAIPIHENALLTDDEIIDRPWRERLWSWPWHPWRKQKTIQVPSRDFLMIDLSKTGMGAGKVIVAHPDMVSKLRKELE